MRIIPWKMMLVATAIAATVVAPPPPPGAAAVARRRDQGKRERRTKRKKQPSSNQTNNKKQKSSTNQNNSKKKHEDDDDKFIDVKQFIMNFKGDHMTQELIKGFCEEVAQKAIEMNQCEDPLSSVFQEHFIPLEETHNHGLYVMFDEAGNIKKIGSASDLANRKGEYDLKKMKFIKFLDLDNISPDFNTFMEEKYQSMMKLLTTHQDLDQFQRDFYIALKEKGGEALGPKKNIFIQMLELGLQIHQSTLLSPTSKEHPSIIC